MNQNLNLFPDLERKFQLAIDWCLPRIKETDDSRIESIVNSHKWATENLHRLLSTESNCWWAAEAFFQYMDSLVARALDFIANDRFLDFAIKEFRDGVKPNEISVEVKDRIRRDACTDLNHYLREILT